MTKVEFINSVVAEPDVIRILDGTEQIVETKDKIEKGFFEVLIIEPQGGKNMRQVWFIRDTITDETDYQTANTIDLKKNKTEARLDRLERTLSKDATILGFSLVSFTGKLWGEFTVYQLVNDVLVKKNVFVYKDPVTTNLVMVDIA